MSRLNRALSLEALEDRRMLAVTVTLSSGTLKITGDAQDNNIAIFQVDGDPDRIVVVGLNGTDIKSDTDDIKFFTASQVKSISVDLKDGNDTLLVGGSGEDAPIIGAPVFPIIDILEQADSVTNPDGDGGNNRLGDVESALWQSVTEDDLETLTVSKDFDIKTGNGEDNVFLQDVFVGGDLKITTGDHDDCIIVNDLQVNKKLTIEAGDHDDDIGLSRFEVFGDISIKGQDGDDTILVLGSEDGQSVAHKKLTVDGGDNDDLIGVAAVQVFGTFKIDGGDGDDRAYYGANTNSSGNPKSPQVTRVESDNPVDGETLDEVFANLESDFPGVSDEFTVAFEECLLRAAMEIGFEPELEENT